MLAVANDTNEWRRGMQVKQLGQPRSLGVPEGGEGQPVQMRWRTADANQCPAAFDGCWIKLDWIGLDWIGLDWIALVHS